MIKPYYDDGKVRIYHGDARRLVGKVGQFTSIITDPVWPNCPDGMLTGSRDPYGLFRSVMRRVPRSCLRMAIVLRCDSDPRFLRAVPKRWPYFQTQVLEYLIPGHLGRKLLGREIAYGFGSPIASAPGSRCVPTGPRVNHNVEARRRLHPCPRHYKHMTYLVRWWSDPGETVLDPFCGSGTTLRAAKDMGRFAVGIEIEERYCEIAARRMEQETLGLGVCE